HDPVPTAIHPLSVHDALPISAAPGLEYVSADPVTIACRGRKSAHELELMRLACEATFDVFRAVFASVKEGMSQEDIGKLVEGGRSEEHTLHSSHDQISYAVFC